MISMPVRSPLCTVRSKVWPAKAFWCSEPSGIAVEEAADFVFQFADAHDGCLAQLPGHLLVRQPLAADDGVHEVALDRVAFAERDVVATLDHARAAALAEQTLHGNRDLEVGLRLLGVQRCEQAGPAGTDDQDVGIVTFEHVGSHRAEEKTDRDEERQRRRRGCIEFLPRRPGQELQRQQAQAAEQMQRQQ